MLVAGQVGKPHGVAGDVYVTVISDDPHRFEPGARLHHEDGRELVVERARAHRDRTLVKFVGIDDRAQADALRGTLFVPPDDVRGLGDDEFWPDDAIGCDVVVVSGESVGTVKDVVGGPAQDLLVLDTPNGERLVPLVPEIVRSVDVDAHRVVIEPPEGLL